MEYTRVDPSKVAESVLADRRNQSADMVANLELDAKRIEFCQAVLMAGPEPKEDPALAEELVRLQEVKMDAEADVLRIESKLTEPVQDRSAARREWLANYLAQIEGEHAAHAVLQSDAEERGEVEQAKQHVIAQIVIEGAHQAAEAELAAIEGKLADAGKLEEIVVPGPRRV